MKKFLFITTLTPSSLLSPLRKSLFEIYLKALNSQSYLNWEALLIGGTEKEEGRVRYIKTEAISKSDKLNVAYQYLLKSSMKPDYIIRLDDDDIISPFALERASQLDFDSYSDEYHTFYELTSAKIVQQKRAWLPNTIIHKYEHAVAGFGENNYPLFTHDHSKTWHLYYRKRNVVFAPNTNPLYMRVLSPTTITGGLKQKKDDLISSFNDISYTKYLSSFGNWSNFNLKDFSGYRNELISIWEDFSGFKITYERSRLGFLNSLINRIKSFFSFLMILLVLNLYYICIRKTIVYQYEYKI